MDTDFTISATATFPKGHGRVTALLDALKGVGKDVRVVIATMTEPTDLMPYPVPVDGKVTFVSHPEFATTQVLVVEYLNEATPDLRRYLTRVAAAPAQHRDAFPALETILFI